MSEISFFYDWNGLNVALFLALNQSGGDVPAALATFGNIVGNYWGMPVLMVVLLLCAGARMRCEAFVSAAMLRLQARRLMVGFAIACVGVALLKVGFDLPRPATVLGAQAHLMGTPHDRYSFPSGHTAYAALVAAVLWPVAWPLWRPLLLAFIAWVAWSRIATGAHFPADVAAGGLVGFLCGWLAHWAVRALPDEGNPAPRKVAFERVHAQARQAHAVEEYERAFGLLQDAHVIGQCLLWPHLRSHVWMLRLAATRRDWSEIRGQLLRIALVPIGNAMGRLPFGNTGDAKVSAFKPMQPPRRLASLLEEQYDR